MLYIQTLHIQNPGVHSNVEYLFDAPHELDGALEENDPPLPHVRELRLHHVSMDVVNRAEMLVACLKKRWERGFGIETVEILPSEENIGLIERIQEIHAGEQQEQQ